MSAVAIGGQLREYAAELVTRDQEQQSALEKKLGELKTQIAQVEALLDPLRLRPQRLLNFEVVLGSDYQCPGCWILHEKRSALRAISGGTNTEDFFKCRECEATFSVSV